MSGPRFSIIPRPAVTDSRLEGRDLQVLALLGGFTDNLGWCSRSQVKMGRELGCSRSTVQRSLGRLIECGYVEHRPLVRDDGGDRAHEYRVLLDEVRPAEFITETDDLPDAEPAPADGANRGDSAVSGVTPLPTSGQGVPTLDGQGVPSHGRAPIRTTLLQRDEREARARRSPEEEEAQLVAAAYADARFMATIANWPTAVSDGVLQPYRAWLTLSAPEREEAERCAETAIAQHALNRKGAYSITKYLAERRWKLLTPSAGGEGRARVAEPPPVTIPAFSQAWCALFFRRWKAGERIKPMFDNAAQRGVGYSVRPAEVPGDEETAALVKIATAEDGRATAEMAAWRDALARNGISFTPQDLRRPYIWVPSQWPPGRGEGAAELADAYFGEAGR